MTQLAFPALPDHKVLASPTIIAADARRQTSAHPPVFLHCGWRTRGTWVWNRFRRMQGVTGYYEPLGEALARLRLSTLASITAESWPSGHRGLARPYFEEYRPLLKPGRPGVRGYQTRFDTGEFFATPDTEQPELDIYLRGMLHSAQECGSQPVLKFCGSIGRIGWLQRHFPDAAHIVVMRDPFAQFVSSSRQFVENGNGYFLGVALLLLAMNRHLPLVSLCVRHIGVELPDLTGCRTPRAALTACEASLRESCPAAWYRGFLAFWVATAATIPDTVDLIIDSDALARGSSYRLRCELELARLTGRMADFGDADFYGDAAVPQSPVLRRSEVLQAHAGAEAFLAEWAGTQWADTSVLGEVARLLAEAEAHALAAGMARQPAYLEAPVLFDEDPDFEAMLLSARGRAAWAERELASLRGSRSWRITAPLRWLRQSLA
jgi:hypothetical protein